MENSVDMNKIIFIIITIAFFGCSSKKINVQARFPAEYTEAASLKTIAIFDFEGKNGKGFTRDLSAKLHSASLDGKAYFTVVSADLIKANSKTRSISGSKNLSLALKHARILGVDGVYYGSISNLIIEKESRKEERTKCLKYKSFFKCEKEKKYTTTCYDQIATLVVQPKLINVNDGKVVYSDSVEGKVKHSYCRDEGKAIGREEFSRSLIADITEIIRKQVAPHNGTMKIKLMKDTKGIEKSFISNFNGAIKFAKAGRMDRACGIWKNISRESSGSNKSISLLYNRGICAEAVSNYSLAIRLYTEADSMLMKPNKKLEKARKRAYKMMENQKKI